MKKDVKNKKPIQNKKVKSVDGKNKKVKQNQFEIKDIHIIIFFGLITFLFFREIILQQKFLWEDFAFQYYPFRNFAAVSLSNGVLPFWNPYTFGGMPFLADIQTAFFYPLHLLLTIFVKGDKLHFAFLEYLIIFHYFMAGVFSYYLARSFDLSKWASVLGGITFMFCGFMVTHAIHETMVIQFAYMPLIFMFYNKSLSTSKLKYILLTGLFMGIAILCGHPQITLYTFFTFLFYGLYQIFFKFKDNHYKIDISIFKFVAIVAIPFILGIMIGAIQLFPTLKLSGLSIRATMSYQESLDGALHYRNLFTLFSPHFFGQSNAAKEGIRYWGHFEENIRNTYFYWESCIYVGLLALVFGMLGIIALWKERIIKFLATISLFSILFILGDNFILYKLFYDFVPGFNIFRGIGRFGLIFAFGFSLLGAYGIDYFINNAESDKVKKFIKYFIMLISGFTLLWLLYQVGLLKWLTDNYIDKEVYDNSTLQLFKTVVILLVLLGLIIWFKKKIISQSVTLLFFILLSFIDLYIFGSKHNTSPVMIEEFYTNKEAIQIIKEDYNGTELYRIKGRSPENLFAFDQNQGMIDFVFMIDGYNPLNLKNRFPPFRENDLMNVKFFTIWDYETEMLRLILNETYAPRAWMAYQTIVESSLENVAKILEDSTFDIKTKVIIDKVPEIPIDKDIENNLIKLKNYSINEITFEIETSENGIFVLSEVYYPNWKVFVNNVEKPMLRCHYSLRGVALEKGTHTVIFKYVDKDFQLGATISLFALAIVVGGFIMLRIKTIK